MINPVIQVEIWSDVMCPFCYIGKRNFENALSQFPHKDKVIVTWKSFQLDPSIITNANKNVHHFLAERKGITPERAKEMNDYVTGLAKEAGLTYNFDKAVVANSFDAHRFFHLAKKHNLQDEAEERLFSAYFTEGKNTADPATLVQLADEIGLDTSEVRGMLSGDEFAEDVERDIYEAEQIGLSGVPFFVFNNSYAIAGARPIAAFLSAMNKVWNEIENTNAQPATENVAGNVCPPGNCEPKE